MVIRRYEGRDKEAIIDLWREVFAYETPHNDPKISLEKKVAVDDGLLYVAEEGGTVIGTAMAGYDGHRGWIYSLAVRADRRGEGAGRRLVEVVIEELRSRGCVKVNLQITGANGGVVGFYEKLGFSVEDRISMGLKLLADTRRSTADSVP